jgi:ABC-type sugar transport system substrate-binding protein
VAARQVLVTVDRVVPAGALADTPQTVGHIVNFATHEWYQNVIRGMQDRADQLGITLEVKDANLDIARQIAAAEDFMAQGVDVRIITPVNEEGEVRLLRRAAEEAMPVVPEGNRLRGMTTMVAIRDHDTGYHAGVAAGEYARDNLGGVARVMNVGLPLLSATVLRSMGFMDGLRRIIPDATLVHDLDGGGNPDRSLEVASAALAQKADINIIFGINDSAALGGLQARKASGRSRAEHSEESLIQAMIGRRIEALYPRTRGPATGPEVLRVEGLSATNVLKDNSFSARPGEVAGFFGLRGGGAQGTGQGHRRLRAGARRAHQRHRPAARAA